MSKLTDHQHQHLQFVRADIESIKAEIARRSNLQRIVLATYIAAIAFVAKVATSQELTAPLLVGLWVSGTLALQFYTREGIEIRRLGLIIRERIAPIVSEILRVTAQDVFPSETNKKFSKLDKITSAYDRQFKWILFLVLPLAITVFYLSHDWSRLLKAIDFCARGSYMVMASSISGLWTLYLLITYAWPEKETQV